ncbi:MAG: ROK family transcriptional regulator [Sphaerochaeta sp.]|nr:ROK family transcriptional regulator [Sphaerochaeta sp.]
MAKINERYRNMLSLFRTLRLEGTLTQADLKERLHLQASTVSYLVNDLRQQNLIINSEKSVQTARVGKPGQYLELDNEVAAFLGLYLEETFIDAHVIGLADQEIHYQRIPLEDCLPENLTKKVIEIVQKFTLVYENIKGVGLAVKSVVDSDGNLSSFKRTVMEMEVPKIWKVQGFSSKIREAFPSLSVIVENDANCAAVYCQSSEKHAYSSSMVFVVNVKPFGIGCGITINGELFRGFTGSSGETFFSDRSIQDLVEENNTHQDPVRLMEMLRDSILKGVYFIDPEQVFLTGGLFADISLSAIEEITALFATSPYPMTILTQEHVSLPAKGAVLLVADAYIESLLSAVDRRQS